MAERINGWVASNDPEYQAPGNLERTLHVAGEAARALLAAKTPAQVTVAAETLQNALVILGLTVKAGIAYMVAKSGDLNDVARGHLEGFAKFGTPQVLN